MSKAPHGSGSGRSTTGTGEEPRAAVGGDRVEAEVPRQVEQPAHAPAPRGRAREPGPRLRELVAGGSGRECARSPRGADEPFVGDDWQGERARAKERGDDRAAALGGPRRRHIPCAGQRDVAQAARSDAGSHRPRHDTGASRPARRRGAQRVKEATGGRLMPPYGRRAGRGHDSQRSPRTRRPRPARAPREQQQDTGRSSDTRGEDPAPSATARPTRSARRRFDQRAGMSSSTT